MVVLCLVFLGRMGEEIGFLRGRPGAIFGVGMFPDSVKILALGCRVKENGFTTFDDLETCILVDGIYIGS